MYKLKIDPVFVKIIWQLFWKRTIWIEGYRHFGERVCYLGVPQGSVLAPILYNIYACDIEQSIPPNVHYIGYADDVVVFQKNNNITNLETNVELAGESIINWCNCNGLELSPEKSVLMLFSRKYKLPQVSIQLGGYRLKKSDFVRYLGVVFDSKLLWRKHVDIVVTKTRKRLNFMRAITGKSWGAHPATQLALFKCIIRPHLEYGSFLFLTAAQTYILKLQRLQWAGLRIVLGSFPSSPNAAVEVLTGIQPLIIRYIYLTDKFLLNSVINTGHPVDTILKHLWNSIEKGIVARHKVIHQYDLNQVAEKVFDNITYEEIYTVPTTDTSLQNLTKHIPIVSLSPVEAIFNDYVLKNYEGYNVIYTDGSKTDDYSGAAYYNTEFQNAFRLPAGTSSYIAEVIALYKALEHIKDLRNGCKYLIITDSLSCVQHLCNSSVSQQDPTVYIKLKKLISLIQGLGNTLVFLWCPAHRGITGNDKADELAKWGSRNGQELQMPLEKDTVRSLIQTESIKDWQEHWESHDTGRFTYGLSPNVSSKPWFKYSNLPRSVIKTVSRIMLNHYALNAHLSRFNIVESPVCDCSEDYQTIDHILWRCPNRCEGRDDFIKKVEELGCQPGDSRTLVSKGLLMKDTVIRIHTFLRRHNISI